MTGGMMQGGGLTQGQQGGSGMMMQQRAPSEAGGHGAHRPGSAEKAEKFFQKKH